MNAASPQPDADRIRLADHVAVARRLLAEDVSQPAERINWAARCGHLEAMLQMLADSAATVLARGDGR